MLVCGCFVCLGARLEEEGSQEAAADGVSAVESGPQTSLRAIVRKSQGAVCRDLRFDGFHCLVPEENVAVPTRRSALHCHATLPSLDPHDPSSSVSFAKGSDFDS